MKFKNLSSSRMIVYATILVVSSCNQVKHKEPAKINPGFTSYISAFTSGTISRKAGVRIRLASDLPDNIDPALISRLFQISPQVRGESYQVDGRTLEFRPEKDLPSGAEYSVNFALGKIIDVPEKLSTFTFGFRTIEQNFNIEHEGIKTYQLRDLRHLYLSGKLTASDIINEKDLPTLLKATQGGRELKINWDYDPEGRFHSFTVDSIIRHDREDVVNLIWDGGAINSDTKGASEISIPELGDFTIMGVSVVQQPEQYISIRFSDPLKENQYLNGLISLENGTDLSLLLDNNELKAYPVVRQSGNIKLTVSPGIRNILDYKLITGKGLTVRFEELKPAVRLLGKGVILPSSEGLTLPFEAVNLKAVDVRVIRIYEDNIAQFLQVNSLDGDYQLKRVGRLITRKTMQLSGAASDLGQWNAFSIDLAELIHGQPGAIYRVELGFRMKHSIYPCDSESEAEQDMEQLEEDFDQNLESEMTYWDAPESYYYESYYYDYEWNERDNPCSPSYYGSRRSVARNVLASDLGIIVKGGSDNVLSVAVSDLKTTEPLSGVELEVLNLQQQSIGMVNTDADGFARIELDNRPFLLIARKGVQRGYLRLDDGSSLSLSRFDVSGARIQKGVKAYIYGERGVWRPGDTVFLTMMLEDKKHILPQDHPVSLELFSPMGQLVKKISRGNSSNGFYSFIFPTGPDAPTGNWSARIGVGGLLFSKSLRIETVKPNRLKINLDFGTEMLSADHPSLLARMSATWLHGAVARDLKTNVSVTLRELTTSFPAYPDYNFDDPVRRFDSDEQTLFDGRLGSDGTASFSTRINTGSSSPGMLRAGFITRVFEESGEFSIDRFSIPYSPYTSYVGIRVPKGDARRGMLLTDTTHSVSIITVNSEGNPVNRKGLDVKIYKVSWRWWWDAGYDNLASYIGSSEHQAVFSRRVNTVDGEGSFRFRIDYPEWGRYLIRVMDPESGHATGKIVYIDWPGWAGRAKRENPAGAAMLSFSSDKQVYNVGETAVISIPASGQGRALVSIENGTEVLRAWWVEANEPETRFRFEVTPEMAPNVYVYVSLVQPHAQTKNDLPIRLYGVIPLMVEDPDTRLFMQLDMPDELRPEEDIEIRVHEREGRECTYTIAMVDEGLLDLTRFRTPDPWNSFYAREALGVKTWDVYDNVIGAYGGKIEQIFAIGGGYDDEGQTLEAGSRAMRFRPMVRFAGPYKLEKGKTASHRIRIPNYVGSVRTMVIAGNRFAYGSTEKTTPVRKPLMVLATLPRVLGPEEEVSLPVTVFAMDESIKNVQVKVSCNDLISIEGGDRKDVLFSTTGDHVEDFLLKVGERSGIGKVQVEVSSGSESATYEIEIEVRNPNPSVSEFVDTVVDPGASVEKNFNYPGLKGTNTAVMEVSGIPPIDFGRRLKYLLSYPYGCVEQVTSAAFPQLYLSEVTEMNDLLRSKTEYNVKAAINKLNRFILPSGGFSYWPGSSEASHWASSYAGHFLLEAGKRGFALPPNFKNQWIRYQSREARKWRNNSEKFTQEDLLQAYRLYTLALAGQPDLGSMNRLRELDGLSIQARWRLAAAYALSGQQNIAGDLISGEVPEIGSYPGFYYSFGSRERDMAMILETCVLMNRRTEGLLLARKISEQLSSARWMSTQTTAFCLIAMSKYAGSGAVSEGLEFSYTINGGKKQNASTAMPVASIQLDAGEAESGMVSFENKGEGILFLRISMQGIPAAGTEKASSSNLNMHVRYTDMSGNPLEIGSIPQGTDFLAHVTLTNPFGVNVYRDMALSQIFPSGWEIHNTRMDAAGSVHHADIPVYQDIRDDRVYTYFNIKQHGSNTYVVQLNASYAGRFYLPGVYCEAMYDESVKALVPGQWVNVVRTE